MFALQFKPMLNKYILPNWKQFKNWSLPSKITFYGSIAGIAFGLFSVYVQYSDTDHSANKTAFLNIVIELSETIIEVRELLPNNIAYEKCINESQQINYDKKFEECMLTIKQNSKEASVKLRKVLAKFQPLVNTEDFKNLVNVYKKIDYTIYEIENNQFVAGKWEANGCPEAIDVKCGNEVNYLTKELFEKNRGCMLSIEAYGSFFERMETNGDLISVVKDSTINKNMVKCIIIPGFSSDIRKYFNGMNNQLVKRYLKDTDELNRTVDSIIL